jgi:NAD(P)-dependent dehydrogenase (short-subunit alcohol dehydrogenase family)
LSKACPNSAKKASERHLYVVEKSPFERSEPQLHQPGIQAEMDPLPESEARDYRAAGKLEGKVAVISGGDSGIGRSIAIMYAKEGADVAILYLNEHEDAEETQRLVEDAGSECIIISGDIGVKGFCEDAVTQIVEEFGGIDILVNNAAEQHQQSELVDISEEQLERTFRTNVFGMFFLTQACMPHLEESHGVIVNTTSVTAYRGSSDLMDYAATKGAIVAFTGALAGAVVEKKVRVNAVAPGPVWTPLIPASFDKEKIERFGENTPMHRAAQPDEIAPSFVFLASDDSSYMTGQVLHPNGGDVFAS